MSKPEKKIFRASGNQGAKQDRTERATEKRRGVQKKLSSPIATGARGVAFEHRVQAVRLLAMCTELPCVGVPDDFAIVKLIFQGRVHEHNTDDLVMTIVGPDGSYGTLRMQMKRSLTPTTKNRAFEEAIGLAWLDFKEAPFRRGLDANFIVYQSASANSMQPAVEVSNMARSSSDATSWRQKVHAEGFSNERNREVFAAIKAVAELYNNAPVTVEELHQFVVHLRFVQHDLDSDLTNEVALQKQILALANVPNSEASRVWAQLVQVCVELNGLGGDIDLNTVERHIGAPLSKQFHTFRTMRKCQRLAQPGLMPSIEGHGSEISPFAAVLGPGAVALPHGSRYPDAVPEARASSLNKLVSRHLDKISDLLKEHRYRDAMDQLSLLGQDMRGFDDHQRARWYLQRGMCRWHTSDDTSGAADDFIKSAALCDDEDKFAAARIHGHMLKDEIPEAVAAGQEALERFPESLTVWASATNARILSGEELTVGDIPNEHEHQALVWQVLATSEERAGNLIAAIQTVKVALSKEDVSFFTKEAFLRYALQLATQENLNTGFRMLSPEQCDLLREATSTFANRSASLWSVQSPPAQAAVLTHLGYAYLLMRRPQDAIVLIEEGRAHGVSSVSLYRVEIEALCDLDRPQEAATRLEALLPQLPNDGLVAYGQAALTAGDFERLQAGYAEGRRRAASPDAERLIRTYSLMQWEAMLRDGQSDKLRNELIATGVTPESTSISDLVFAARAHLESGGDEQLAAHYISRVAELSLECLEFSEGYLGAQLLFYTERFIAAAAVYERILPANSFSALHTDLLACYLRMGQRTKARELLRTMPQTWRQSPDARHLALELSQLAGDWPMVGSIAEAEMAADPKQVTSWLLRIVAAANNQEPSLAALIGDAPEELFGSIQHVVQLASAEIRHGHVKKGLQRLYRIKRLHMGETEAAALHLIAVLRAEVPLEELEGVPEVIGPGTSVVLSDPEGIERRLTIDPEGIDGLPVTEEFFSSKSPEAKRLFGLRLNEYFEVTHFGETKIYSVTQLYSAHRRLIETSHLNISSALSPSRLMAAMPLKTVEDGTLDLTAMRRQVESRLELAVQTLDLYKQHPAPLGIIAKQLGCDVIDLVRGWPRNGPKLEVVSGLGHNKRTVQELLSKEAVWVVDLAMLTELATLGHLDVLKHLPKTLVCTATRDAVARKVEETSTFRVSGTMFAKDGQLGFQENTEEDWHREQDLLNSIDRAIADNCIVMPAYGPDVVEPNLFRMSKVLSAEEYSIVLLCLEQKASLLTLDDRLRKVAFLFGVNSAWPQALLFFMTTNEKIRHLDYSLAVLKMFFWQRTFVSLSVNELTAMMDQGNSWLTVGVNTLREYLSDHTIDFKSAARVVQSFIGWIYRRGNCELGVALELVEYLIEPLLRHKDCPGGWPVVCTSQLWGVLGFSSDEQEQRCSVTYFVNRAMERLKHPMKHVAIKAGVLYCTITPRYVTGVFDDQTRPPKGQVQDEKRASTPDDVSVTYAAEDSNPSHPSL